MFFFNCENRISGLIKPAGRNVLPVLKQTFSNLFYVGNIVLRNDDAGDLNDPVFQFLSV